MMVIIVVLICIFVLLVYMWLQARENNIIELEIYDENLPESFDRMNLFFISDIHRRIINQELINKVKDEADIVIIGGDLTEKGVPLSRTEENLKRLNSIGPVYFIWGNNDYEIETHQMERLLFYYNVKILENHREILRSEKGEKIYLVGIGETSLNNDKLDQAVNGIEEAYKIVICHNPEIMKKVEDEHGVSLMLCGHTHGGQIRIFGYGPYSKGRFYSLKNSKLLISNGYGTTKLPLRLGAKPETHLITIKRK